MTLASGARFGPYEILSPLGAGGMGEVYKARDTRLDRVVAIKVLPSQLSSDPERRARFEREARAISALSHPHICALYDVGEQDGVAYLVMEHLEGETLAQRLSKGALPLGQALELGIAVADALAKAHKQGILHRDLKPGNVMLTKAGPKLLDFGLAKAHAPRASAASMLSQMPTGEKPLTSEGTLLGTFQYMAPEQLEGKESDQRADIWALGCVLYETVTGRRAFDGKSQASLIAAILEKEPEPISAQQPLTPPALDRIVRKCLAKDRDARWDGAHDVADELRWIADVSAEAGVATPAAARRRWRERVAIGLAGLALGAVATAVAVRQLAPMDRSAGPVARFAIAFASETTIEVPRLALSPDGTRLVYVAAREGTTQLYLRRIEGLEAAPLRGTEGGTGPFFSPDGEWIGFFAGGKLKKVAVAGDVTSTLCDVSGVSRGASWGPDDTIVFAHSLNTGLLRVSASGGTPEVLTTPDPSRNEGRHNWPEFLPGGETLLFVPAPVGTTIFDASVIEALSLATGERKTLYRGGSAPHYAASGHLLFARPGVVLALPFDARRLAVTGSPTPVIEGVRTTPRTNLAQYAVSAAGTLAFVPGLAGEPQRSLVWVDRKGREQPLPAPPRGYEQARLSPDGTKIALHILGETTGDIWVYELPRGALTRLTLEVTGNETPAWTPDGRRVTYASVSPRETGGVFWKPADSSGPEEQLWKGKDHLHVEAWSPDSRALVLTDSRAGGDVVILTRDAGARPLRETTFEERSPAFSPDGRWLAYASDATSRMEVYVEAFPGPGGRWQISTDGGRDPVWARSGKELLYRSGDRMMAVPLSTGAAFSPGPPAPLFEGRYLWSGNRRTFDISPDGQRFLMIKEPKESAAGQINVVLGWFEELKRKVPAAGRAASP